MSLDRQPFILFMRHYGVVLVSRPHAREARLPPESMITAADIDALRDHPDVRVASSATIVAATLGVLLRDHDIAIFTDDGGQSAVDLKRLRFETHSERPVTAIVCDHDGTGEDYVPNGVKEPRGARYKRRWIYGLSRVQPGKLAVELVGGSVVDVAVRIALISFAAVVNSTAAPSCYAYVRGIGVSGLARALFLIQAARMRRVCVVAHYVPWPHSVAPVAALLPPAPITPSVPPAPPAPQAVDDVEETEGVDAHADAVDAAASALVALAATPYDVVLSTVSREYGF